MKHISPQQMFMQRELTGLKQATVLNPHFNMVLRYLDCLNHLADQLLPSGNLVAWLVEVQYLITLLHRRLLARLPLSPVERKSLLNFANYWRSMSAPPYGLAKPEAQIVMITLLEFAQH